MNDYFTIHLKYVCVFRPSLPDWNPTDSFFQLPLCSNHHFVP